MLELNAEEVRSPPRDAATVVLLRDGAVGVEVFMLRRHGESDVLGGAYVFPGGKVDAVDALVDARNHLDQNPETLLSRIGEPMLDTVAACALHVAAIREAYEECGVLFCTTAPDPQALSALMRQGMAFDEVLERLRLRLYTAPLVPWTRWITPRVPSMMRKRFDTRFFVARMPADQLALHDNHEADHSIWVSPLAALRQYHAGEIDLAPPQIMSLNHLAQHESVASVLGEAQTRPPPVIMPEPFDHEGTRVLTYPGDPRHSVTQRAMPGPTRLIFRDGRFRGMQGHGLLACETPA